MALRRPHIMTHMLSHSYTIHASTNAVFLQHAEYAWSTSIKRSIPA